MGVLSLVVLALAVLRAVVFICNNSWPVYDTLIIIVCLGFIGYWG